MMNKIRALIIDDEELAREVIRSFLEKDETITVIGECANGFDGFKEINEQKPDLVFLDVMMPKLTGFEMLELLEEPPVVIFSTAHDEFAIRAFEQNAVDYLLKPYSQERFVDALARAKAKLALEEHAGKALTGVVEQNREHSGTLSRVAVRTGSKIQIVPVGKIRYLEAMDDYVKLHTEQGVFLKQDTMKHYDEHLPAEDFIRIHRSYIVRLKEIVRLELLGKDSHVVFLQDGTQLSVSRSGYALLKEALGF